MDYTYKIVRIDAPQRFLRVVYSSVGREDFSKVLNPTDFDESALDALIKASAPIAEWEWADNAPAVDEQALGVGVAKPVSYIPPDVTEPTDPTLEEQIAALIAVVENDRFQKEGEGIYWTDPGGQLYWFDTTDVSQNRLNAARASAYAGTRTELDVWKCAQVDFEGNRTLKYRPTTNEEIIAIANAAYDFIQKCFDAEAAAVQKIIAGNLSADFAMEFSAL